MPLFVVPILWGILAYLVGSINWGYLVARWYGVDILSVGNRNPGAGNVFRTVGPIQGIAVYVADVLTGASVVIPAGWLPLPEVCRLVASVMILVGTMYPLFSGFRGGTGLAKGMGAVMGVNPAGFFLGVPLGALVVWRLHDTGWAGALVVGTALLFSVFFYSDWVGSGNIAAIGALIFLRSLVQYRSVSN